MVAASVYSTALALGAAAPTYVAAKAVEDVERLTAYSTYEDIYNNVPTVWASVMRDDDDTMSKRFVPAARPIVEATNRYLGRDLTWAVTDLQGLPLDDNARLGVQTTLDALFTREEFVVKFGAVKRTMLIKGDGLLHITADPLKPEGTRLRITELKPDTFFPIFDPVDADRVIGVYIVTLVLADDGTTFVAQRLEYRRILTPEDLARFPNSAPGGIWVRLGYFQQNKWDDRLPLTEADLTPTETPTAFDSEATAVLAAGVMLPATITAIPVYHFRNIRGGAGRFGVSEIQGCETMLAGVNQVVSDEDLAVSMQGIGVYWTDSGHPVNERGEEVDWVIGPAAMIEVQPGKKMQRVDGGDIAPMVQHHDLLQSGIREATSVPDIAVGRVDVQVASSGVALALELSPITSKNAEKEEELRARLDQMVFDILTGWLPAYESFSSPNAMVRSHFGSAVPVNAKETIDQVGALVTAGIVSKEWAQGYLSDTLGFTFPTNMLAQIAAEQAAVLDTAGVRIDAEAGAQPPIDAEAAA